MDDTGTKKPTVKGDEKFFIFKLNILKDVVWAIIIGFFISIVFSIYKLYVTDKDLIELIKNFNLINYLGTYLISFSVGFLIKVFLFNCVNSKIYNAKYGIGNGFFNLLINLLKDLERPNENENKLKETAYFLNINNARTGHMLQFNPDNDSINMLHKVKGMISITQAEPSEWLNPTYNFFLVNNYIATLAQSIKTHSPITGINFSANRSESHFVEFEKKKKSILLELSQLNYTTNIISFLNDNRIFVRFYIIKEEEIENNRSIIETLIAGHDLFGSYLYFINQKVYDDLMKNHIAKRRFETFLKSINYDLKENKDKIDLAVALHDENLEVIYRKQDDLVSRNLNESELSEFNDFISSLCGLLHNNFEQPTHLFDSYFIANNYTKNDRFCHILYEK